MHPTTLVGFTVALLACGLATADEPARSPQQEFESLVRAQRDAQTAFRRASDAATTKDEKAQAMKDFQQQSAGFLKFIQTYPNDPVALKAMDWLLRREPAGQATTAAVQSLGDDLIKSQDMVDVCRSLGGLSNPNSERLLSTIIAKNPHRDVQGQARVAQCSILKDRLDSPRASPQSRAVIQSQLEKQLETLIEEYGDVKDFRGTLKETAEAELFEIRFLGIGATPPDLVGKDLDGKPLKLSDFRGKVVLVVFWGTWCGPCMAAVPEHVELLQKHANKPFAVVGITSDRDRAAAKKIGIEKRMTWQSWWDGGSNHGPIATKWNVSGWPTNYLLDATGTIRYKGDMLRASSVRRNAKGEFEQYRLLDDFADQLVNELEASK